MNGADHRPREGSRSHGFPDFLALLLLGQAQFVLLLQFEPKLRSRAEPPPKAQGRVGRHRPLSVEDLGDAIGRDAQLPPQLGRADTERVELDRKSTRLNSSHANISYAV